MLKKKRKEKNITLSELSEITGMSKSYLNKLENKRFSNVTIQVILKLSQKLDIDKTKLFLFFSEIESAKIKNID